MVIENSSGPILQLESNGLLRSRTVKIDTDTWPDYVFEEGYELMSLKEIEKYIDSNGHLPGVPSSEEVIEDGINVGEMNEILMKKLEELTLLMIQQQKEIDLLKTQVKEQ